MNVEAGTWERSHRGLWVMSLSGTALWLEK